jgi:hypothetical protein
MVYGNPYGPPKSGWSFVLAAAIDDSHGALWMCTGSVEMSVFQMLSDGKTWQLVVGGEAAPAGRASSCVQAATAPAQQVAERCPGTSHH